MEGLIKKMDVGPVALNRACSFKTGQWLRRIEGRGLSNAVLLFF